jgi:hypothetical protein
MTGLPSIFSQLLDVVDGSPVESIVRPGPALSFGRPMRHYGFATAAYSKVGTLSNLHRPDTTRPAILCVAPQDSSRLVVGFASWRMS